MSLSIDILTCKELRMLTPTASRHRSRACALTIACSFLQVTPSQGATPGLPFSEDFTSTSLRDTANTSAQWNTSLGTLRLPDQLPLVNVAGMVGANIGNVTSSARSLALGDFDGDGHLDLLAAGQGSDRIFLNNGTTIPFNSSTKATLLTGSSARTISVAVEDFDLDGDLDLLLAKDASGSDNHLYFNNGSATPFSGVAPVNLDSLFKRASSLEVGDIDNDGDADIVVGYLNTPDRYYLNRGDGTFAAGISLQGLPAAETRAVRLGDMDGDGRLDLVVATTVQPVMYLGEARWDLATGTVEGTYLFLNNGTSTPFGGVTPKRISDDENILPSADALALGDVNGDGNLDVVIGNLGFDRVYLNNGAAPGMNPFAGVSGANVSDDQRNTHSVVLVDIDRDGDLDYVAGNRARTHGLAADNVATDRLYLNNGSGTFSAGLDISADTTIDTFSLVADDINGDGTVDIVAGWSGSISRFYLNRGTPSGAPATAQLRGDGQSLRIDDEQVSITSADLDVYQTLPAHTSIRYWLSSDGGWNWKLSHPGRETGFLPAGVATDLRWRAELRTLSPAHLPSVSTLNLRRAGSASTSGPYEQEPSGTVSIEAENSGANIAINGGPWRVAAPGGTSGGASGGQAMQASSSGRPRLEYDVNFRQTGTYHVWIRSWGSGGASDSAYFGFDGNWLASKISMAPLNSWVWSGPFTLNIGAAGVHTLGITRNESLAQVDKIFIGTSAGAAPTGTGPAESIRGGASTNTPPVVEITSPANGASFDESATVNFTATATDNEDGVLTPSLAWSSSRDGNLGTFGAAFSTAALSVGTHTITAKVNDSGLATGSNSISVTITAVTSGTGPYNQNANGTFSIEAEHADANVMVSGGLWELIAPSGASGGQAMEAPFDNGQPRLEYRVNFSLAGTYYVWVRSWGTAGTSDSAYFGLDGAWLANRVNMSPRNSWVWSGPFTLSIGSTGTHVLGITHRESRARVDKIFIGTSAGATPTGTGPAESSRGP